MGTSYRRRLAVRCLLLLSLIINIIPASASIPLEENVEQWLQLREAETAERSFLEGDKWNQKNGNKRRLNPSVGDNIKVLVLPVKFADHVDREVPTIEYLEEFFNGVGSSEINEVGSVREWLRRNSNGKYNVQFVIRDWDVSTRTEKETAAGTSGLGQNLYPFFRFALDKVDNDPEFDWWSGFVDEEGFLNHLVVLHSGYMAESRDLSTCLDHNGLRKDRIWSTGSSEARGGDDTWQSKDWVEVRGFSMLSAFGIPTCLSRDPTIFSVANAIIGPIVHEFSHGFGLPDLYDLNVPPVGGVGIFSTMSSSQGWDFSAATPGHLDGYCRSKIGWADPHEIIYDGYYALQPLEMSSQLYKISKGYPEGEYLLIENKQPILFDKDVDTGGIVIYHVDENQSLQRNVGYPGSAGWPASHYMLAVQQADGLYDIEKGENIGDATDFFVKGHILKSGGDFPNTDAYSTGTLQSTGITIEILSESRFVMVFKVTGLGARGVDMPMVGAHLAREFENDLANSLADVDESDFDLVERNSPSDTLQWILGMLMGVGLMLGLALVLL